MLCNYMGNISSWNLVLPHFGLAFLETHGHGWEEVIWSDQSPEEGSATVSSSWLDKEVFGGWRRNVTVCYCQGNTDFIVIKDFPLSGQTKLPVGFCGLLSLKKRGKISQKFKLYAPESTHLS